MRVKDRTGQKWNRLEAIEFSHKDSGNNAIWKYKCDCGAEHLANASQVASGSIKSCGCLLKDINSKNNTTHGASRTKAYRTWASMKDRCFNEKSEWFSHYGFKGITVCTRWLQFENFLEDMGQPKRGQSLDRIDNAKGYCKENCRWTNQTTQIRNRSNSVVWIIDGKEYDGMEEAVKATGIGKNSIRRMCKGWTKTDSGKYYEPKAGCGTRLKYKEVENG